MPILWCGPRPCARWTDAGVADQAIEACLTDSYLGVGLAAAKSLARHRDAGAVDALIDFAFRNDGTYRRDIGKLLGRFAPEPGAQRLIEILHDDRFRRDWLVGDRCAGRGAEPAAGPHPNPPSRLIPIRACPAQETERTAK